MAHPRRGPGGRVDPVRRGCRRPEWRSSPRPPRRRTIGPLDPIGVAEVGFEAEADREGRPRDRRCLGSEVLSPTDPLGSQGGDDIRGDCRHAGPRVDQGIPPERGLTQSTHPERRTDRQPDLDQGGEWRSGCGLASAERTPPGEDTFDLGDLLDEGGGLSEPFGAGIERGVHVFEIADDLIPPDQDELPLVFK